MHWDPIGSRVIGVVCHQYQTRPRGDDVFKFTGLNRRIELSHNPCGRTIWQENIFPEAITLDCLWRLLYLFRVQLLDCLWPSYWQAQAFLLGGFFRSDCVGIFHHRILKCLTGKATIILSRNEFGCPSLSMRKVLRTAFKQLR